MKKNSQVLVITGSDKGKKGKILRIKPVLGKVLVEGVALKKKHVKPKKEGEKGQIVEFPSFISISNVKLICPRCNRATRSGKKCQHCQAEL